MATKNYNQMSTKKLNALLETASDDEKTAIQEVLDKRNAASAGAGAQNGSELSEEEKAAIAAAEAENGGTAEQPAKPAKEKAPKMTDEEREALAEKLRAEAVDHKCQVVPFNSIEWVDGVIVAIIEEKRTNKVLFAIKADDGRRIVKAHDSQLIKILDETVERAKRTRGARKSDDAAEASDWTDEEIEAAINEVVGNVGKTVSYPEAGAYGQIAENAATVTGRIISLVPAKRSKSILYRIELDQDDKDAPKKYAHKVSTLDSLEIAEELDEVGQKINDAYVARRNREPSAPKEKLNEKQVFDKATTNLAKAEEALEKAKALVEKRKVELDKAKEAYNAAIAEGKTFEDEAPASEEAPAESAEEQNDENLM